MDNVVKRKLSILVGLIVSIFVFMIFMFFQVGHGDDLVIKTVSFRTVFMKEIPQMIPEVKQEEFFNAQKNYEYLTDEVLNEKLLNKISDTTVNETLSELCSVYSRYVVSVGRNIKKKGDWTNSKMNGLRENSQLILNNEFCPKDVRKELTANMQLVVNFFKAQRLIESSHVFESVEKALDKVNQKNQLLAYQPFAVCESLIDDLNKVGDNLFFAHLNYVKMCIGRAVAMCSTSAVNTASIEKDHLFRDADKYNRSQDEVRRLLSNDLRKLEEISIQIGIEETQNLVEGVDEGVF